jgi:pimeloyl-ACP methyl ester carboxylesterase
MRRWLAVPLFAAVAAFTSLDDSATSSAFAQKGKDTSDLEQFTTADGVELQGRFHRASSPKGPIVILLYPPVSNAERLAEKAANADQLKFVTTKRSMDQDSGDWKGLARRLNDEGYHVFRFDWRGHGKSTTIKEPERFWSNPWTGPANTKYVKEPDPKSGVLKKPSPFKKDLRVSDIANLDAYMPVLIQDLAAVRLHLDKNNDDAEKGVSSSSIYVIGAGEAAVLGMLWMRTEWDRPAVLPKQNQFIFGATDYAIVPQKLASEDYERAGDTVAGGIWLSPAIPRAIPPRTIDRWFSGAPRMRDSNPMKFVWSAKDAKDRKVPEDKRVSEELFRKALVGDEKAAKSAGLKILPPLDEDMAKAMGIKPGEGRRSGYEVPNTSLKGGWLLGDDQQFKTETRIIGWLNEMDGDRGKRPRSTRGFDTRYYINPAPYGVAVQ